MCMCMVIGSCAMAHVCMYVRGKLIGDDSLLLSRGFLESKGLVVDTYSLSHLAGLKTVMFLKESEMTRIIMD